MSKIRSFAIAMIITFGLFSTASLQVSAILPRNSGNQFQVYLPLMKRTLELSLIEHVTELVPPVVVTDIVDPGDGRFFIATRDGRIQVSSPDGTVQPDLLLDIRDRVFDNEGEMGLIGLATHPDFATNGYIYVHYNESVSSDYYSVIARYHVNSNNQADPASEQRMLRFQQPSISHQGGALQFGPHDGYLYIAVGDGGTPHDNGGYAQSTSTLLGKILRIDVDRGSPYAIPPDNPFVTDNQSRDEIWMLGLRNPWRISFDRLTGDMYIGDVGQNTWEEINFIPANSGGGQNFGWPCKEGLVPYREEACNNNVAYTDPIFTYPQKNDCAAVTAGYVYRGSKIPALVGRFMFADLCFGDIWSLTPVDQQQWVAQNFGTLGIHATTFGERFDGELFLGAANNQNIYQIVND